MSRQAQAVAIGLFVVAYGTNVSTPFLVLYRDGLELTDNQTQMIFVVYVVGILSTLMIAGQLSDRYGRKPLLVTALAFSAVASLLMIFGRDSFALLLVGRVLLGGVSGAGLGVAAAWLQELVGSGQEKKAALIATLVTYGGFGAAPPISVLYEWIGPSPLVVPFLLHMALAVAVIPIVLWVDETVDVAAAARRGPWRPSVRFGVPASARRGFLWYVTPLAVLVFAFPSMAFSLFPVLLSDTVGASQVLLTGVSGTSTAWGGLLARPFLERVTSKESMGLGAAIGTVGYIMGTTAFLTGAWLLVWPAAVLLGAASGIIATTGLALVGQLTNDDTRGTLTSTFYLLAYIGMTLPLIVSALGGAIGTTPVLIGITVLAGTLALTAPARRRIAALS